MIEYCFFIAVKNSGNNDNISLDFVTESDNKSIGCFYLEIVSFVGRSVVKILLNEFS